jgi:hypothetical protein
MASMYSGRYDSPVCHRLCGIHIDQEDDPWWLVGVLGWLGMYRQIMESGWSEADAYRRVLEMKLKTEPPSFLYEFYKGFCQFMEQDLKR